MLMSAAALVALARTCANSLTRLGGGSTPTTGIGPGGATLDSGQSSVTAAPTQPLATY